MKDHLIKNKYFARLKIIYHIFSLLFSNGLSKFPYGHRSQEIPQEQQISNNRSFLKQNVTPCFKTSIKRELKICFTNLFMRYFPNGQQWERSKTKGGCRCRWQEFNKSLYLFLGFSSSIFWRLSSKSLESRKTLLAEFEIVCAISLAASIFLRVMNAGLLAMAWPMSWALVASPCQPLKEKLLQREEGWGTEF